MFLLAAGALRADGVLDRVDDALTASGFQDSVRLRLSGALDLEGYHLDQPSPGLILTDKDNVFNPRLSLFLDGQIGPYLYIFAQSRADRGFDPSDGAAEIRLEEYAIRISPSPDGSFNLQIGQFATVFGGWVPRHGSWDNPFITAPLPYENLTGIWDTSAATRGTQVLDWAGLRPNQPSGAVLIPGRSVPIIWGPSYASGAAAFGEVGRFEYATEVKNGALSSRPETWSVTRTQWQDPTFSGRVGYLPDEMWKIGLSASTGSYLLSSASSPLAPGVGLGNYREIVFGQDASFAWHHLQLWAELFETRFQIPTVGNADTTAYYLEAKYKLTPQFFGSLRWNQQFFSTLPDATGSPVTWGRDVSRIDLGAGYRFTLHTQFKLQCSLQHEASASRKLGDLLAGQFTVRF
jgi:hypothetical protein